MLPVISTHFPAVNYYFLKKEDNNGFIEFINSYSDINKVSVVIEGIPTVYTKINDDKIRNIEDFCQKYGYKLSIIKTDNIHLLSKDASSHLQIPEISMDEYVYYSKKLSNAIRMYLNSGPSFAVTSFIDMLEKPQLELLSTGIRYDELTSAQRTQLSRYLINRCFFLNVGDENPIYGWNIIFNESLVIKKDSYLYAKNNSEMFRISVKTEKNNPIVFGATEKGNAAAFPRDKRIYEADSQYYSTIKSLFVELNNSSDEFVHEPFLGEKRVFLFGKKYSTPKNLAKAIANLFGLKLEFVKDSLKEKNVYKLTVPPPIIGINPAQIPDILLDSIPFPFKKYLENIGNTVLPIHFMYSDQDYFNTRVSAEQAIILQKLFSSGLISKLDKHEDSWIKLSEMTLEQKTWLGASVFGRGFSIIYDQAAKKSNTLRYITDLIIMGTKTEVQGKAGIRIDFYRSLPDGGRVRIGSSIAPINPSRQ